jgi:hypothetical protein
MNAPTDFPPQFEADDQRQPEEAGDDSAFEEESQYTDTESL